MLDSAPSIVHVESLRRSSTTWTVELIRSAEALADAGALSLMADLCTAIGADDRVRGALETRAKSLLSVVPTFELAQGRRRRMAARALEAEEDWWTIAPESTLEHLMSQAALGGLGIAEKVWVDVGARTLPTLVPWGLRGLRWSDAGWTMDTGDRGTVKTPVAAGDRKWFLYTPQGAKFPWQRGAWRALARLWLLKQYALDDWARHSEVHGSPLRVGTAPAGTTAADRELLAEDLARIGRDAAFAMQPGYDLKLVEAVARTWEMFRAQIEMANVGIQIALAGQVSTAEVAPGTHTGSTVQGQVHLARSMAEAEALSTALHDQVLSQWSEVNFTDASAAPWPVWDLTPPETPSQYAARLTASVAAYVAAKAALGDRFDEDRAVRDLDLPMKQAA